MGNRRMRTRSKMTKKRRNKTKTGSKRRGKKKKQGLNGKYKQKNSHNAKIISNYGPHLLLVGKFSLYFFLRVIF